jgi:hypothetical protein
VTVDLESVVSERDRIRGDLAALTERHSKCPLRTFDQIAADRMADEIALLVRRKEIDARSPAADALLDYREPSTSERSDRMLELTHEVERLLAESGRQCALALRERDHAERFAKLWRDDVKLLEDALTQLTEERNQLRAERDELRVQVGALIDEAQAGK